MSFPAYSAARAAARRVYPHFARILSGADAPASGLLPEVETIESIIDAAFWASLRREENYTPRISLGYVSAGHLPLPLTLERQVPFTPEALTRLGPAVEGPGVHLCVWPNAGGLSVWGAARNLPRYCFVIEVIAPGQLIIKHSRGDGSGKFVNVSVLQGDQIKVIDQDSPIVRTREAGGINLLLQLAVAMRAHGRGGILIILPPGNDTWRESVLHPVTYAVAPPFSALKQLMREDEAEREGRRWLDSLRRLVAGFAGLTAVDGATIITQDYELLAFGAKLVRPRGRGQISAVIISEPIEGTEPFTAEPGQLGGTRHLAAAQFVHDQRGAKALVASQDGRFTVFEWSEDEQVVRARRIEALLL